MVLPFQFTVNIGTCVTYQVRLSAPAAQQASVVLLLACNRRVAPDMLSGTHSA